MNLIEVILAQRSQTQAPCSRAYISTSTYPTPSQATGASTGRQRADASEWARQQGVTTAALADHATVDAGPTWHLIDELLSWGYTRTAISHALGKRSHALQIQRTRCTLRTAHEVQKLHARWKRVDARSTLALIAELREEGYRPDRIQKMVTDFATMHGRPAPGIVATNGFVDAAAAELVARLHVELLDVADA